MLLYDGDSPASTVLAELSSISFAGSPLLTDPVAVLRQSGSWDVEFQDDGVMHHRVNLCGGVREVGEGTLPLWEG